jgi:16S rRNA (cytosine967-C5)-methyltransferase
VNSVWLKNRFTARVVTLVAMKIHRTLAAGVVAVADAVLKNGEVAQKTLDKTFENNKKWGKRDRAFVAEHVYELVRWKRMLGIAAGRGDAWSMLGAQIIKKGGELPEWEEFAHLEVEKIKINLARPSSDFSREERESIPRWLDELGQQELGERWEAEIHAQNGEAPVVIRVNTLKITRDELQEQLRAEGFETLTVEGVPDALQLTQRRSLTKFLNEGLCEVQDAASQLVAPFLQVEFKQSVIDCCAGAGGKSLHIAAVTRNRGSILSLDVAGEKLAELRRRALRGNAKVRTQKATPEFLETLHESADRVLIDAPCSGSGTLRRQPDIKWRLNQKTLDRTRNLQREILTANAPLVKVGGKLVYATCSIFPSENEAQVEWFLEQNPNFELEESKSVLTSETGFDGFFMARLIRVQ